MSASRAQSVDSVEPELNSVERQFIMLLMGDGDGSKERHFIILWRPEKEHSLKVLYLEALLNLISKRAWSCTVYYNSNSAIAKTTYKNFIAEYASFFTDRNAFHADPRWKNIMKRVQAQTPENAADRADFLYLCGGDTVLAGQTAQGTEHVFLISRDIKPFVIEYEHSIADYYDRTPIIRLTELVFDPIQEMAERFDRAAEYAAMENIDPMVLLYLCSHSVAKIVKRNKDRGVSADTNADQIETQASSSATTNESANQTTSTSEKDDASANAITLRTSGTAVFVVGSESNSKSSSGERSSPVRSNERGSTSPVMRSSGAFLIFSQAGQRFSQTISTVMSATHLPDLGEDSTRQASANTLLRQSK